MKRTLEGTNRKEKEPLVFAPGCVLQMAKT